jgi:hypothetical protein
MGVRGRSAGTMLEIDSSLYGSMRMLAAVPYRTISCISACASPQTPNQPD